MISFKSKKYNSLQKKKRQLEEKSHQSTPKTRKIFFRNNIIIFTQSKEQATLTRALTLRPPDEGPFEWRRTNTLDQNQVQDPNPRRFSVQVGTKFLGSRDLRREIHSSINKSKKLSDNLAHSEDSKNGSEHSRAESSADSFDDKKSKTPASPIPTPLVIDTDNNKDFEEKDEEEDIELTRRKSQKRSYIAKKLISFDLEKVLLE